jgi:fibronectin-binding autotransporter adhesin
MPRLKNHILIIALILTAGTAPAQTVVTWGGGFPNDNFSTAANWLPSPPLNDGTEILTFDTNSDGSLFLNATANFLGISVVGGYGFGTDATLKGTHSISIGGSGILVQDGGGGSTSSLQFNQNVQVILTAPQTWDLGTTSNSLTVVGTITDTGGAPALTLSGANGSYATFTFYSGLSTFTGGVTVQGMGTGLIVGASSTGSPSVTSGPLGTGTLTLGDGTQLTTSTFNPVTIGNPVMLGDDSNGAPIALGGSTTRSNPANVNLTLSGPISLYLSDEEIDVGSNSRVTLSGVISGPSYCLDFGGQGAATGSLAIVTGPVSISRLDLEDNGTVIFDGGPSQLTLAYNIGTQPDSYVGTGSSYAGSVATFLAASKIDLNASTFSGTLGLDTVSGPSATFGDAIDLTGFTGGSFVGLGSATSAISTGTITPPGGLALMSGTTYPFGGGGGTLFVAGPLQDSSYYDGEVYVPEANNVQLSPGNAPLTLILQGALTYSGTTSSVGGALIFDTPVSPGSGPGSLYIGNGSTIGYIGYSESAALSPSSFLALINESSVNGVVGFDSHNPATPVVLSGVTIDLTQGNAAPFTGDTFLGTATRATLDNTTTIIPVSGVPYQFAAVKGGWLTVDTNLADYTNPVTSAGTNSVVVGLPNPMESFGSQSSVTLSGNNSYSGGTTLNSGYLYVTTSNSIGTGPLFVPDPSPNRGWAATLAALGSAVSLSNDIFLPNSGLALNTGSPNRLTLTGPIQDDIENNGSLGIFGPVDLNGANTYSGGTTISVSPSTVINVGSNTGLGTGWVNAFGGTINFTSPLPSLGNLQLSGSTLNFLGSPIISSLQMAQTTVNFADGTSPEIDGLNGDSASGNVINLGTVTGATLTLNLGSDPDFGGTINGPGGLVVNGNDLNLTAANTYTGGTTIGANGTVIASNNSALGTGGVVVNSGGTLATNVGVTVHNGITLDDGGTIAGFGTFSSSGSLAFQNGSNLIPGAVIISSSGPSSILAIGSLAFGGGTFLTFGSGGNMAFSLMDANGAPGAGYSTVSVSGGLTITNSGSPFNVYLFSYAPGTNIPEATPAANFNPALPYQWTLLSTTTGITGFAANDFSVSTSFSGTPTFLNSTGVGSFFVSEVGNDLMLNFTPVPEPTSLALMASGLCALGAAFRRRRR